jgi:hypothetical protein
MPKRSDRPARREGAVAAVPWLMFGVSLALTGTGLFLLTLTLGHPHIPVFDYWVENTVVAVGFSTVGAVITSRASHRNRVGWILCMLGLVGGIRLFSAEYAVEALLVTPGRLPFGEAFAWISTWLWVPHIGLLVFTALLFPDGRLASSRMRWVARLNGGIVAAGVALAAFAPGPVFGLEPIGNPLGIDRLSNLDELVEALIYTFGIAASASLLVRLRRARGIERQQIKWFIYALSVGAGGAVCGYVLSPGPGRSWVGAAGFILIMSSILGSRSRSASPSSGTACTTSTSSSTAHWSTGC